MAFSLPSTGGLAGPAQAGADQRSSAAYLAEKQLTAAKRVNRMITLQINSGMARQRIVAYLEEELQLSAIQEGVYVAKGCTITLEPLIQPDAALKIPRTLVSFTGEAEACRQYQQQFRLHFLSAGG